MSKGKHEWPTREEWAKRQRSTYWDSDQFPNAFTCTSEEVEAACAKFKTEWSRLGKELKLAIARCPLARRGDETLAQYCARYYALVRDGKEAEQKLWDEVERIRLNRMMLREAVEYLRGGINWPRHTYEFITDAIAAPWQRSEQLREAAIEEYEAKCRATPIDDEAWAKELEWRRKQEEQVAEGERHGWTVTVI